MIEFKPHGAKRLLKLAAILDKADALHKKRNEPGYCQKQITHVCGTPACALGHWAAANPRRWKLNYLVGAYLKPSQTSDVVENGVAEFGLTSGESDMLFGVFGCDKAQTGKEAAKFIRIFVKNKLKEFGK